MLNINMNNAYMTLDSADYIMIIIDAIASYKLTNIANKALKIIKKNKIYKKY